MQCRTVCQPLEWQRLKFLFSALPSCPAGAGQAGNLERSVRRSPFLRRSQSSWATEAGSRPAPACPSLQMSQASASLQRPHPNLRRSQASARTSKPAAPGMLRQCCRAVRHAWQMQAGAPRHLRTAVVLQARAKKEEEPAAARDSTAEQKVGRLGRVISHPHVSRRRQCQHMWCRAAHWGYWRVWPGANRPGAAACHAVLLVSSRAGQRSDASTVLLTHPVPACLPHTTTGQGSGGDTQEHQLAVWQEQRDADERRARHGRVSGAGPPTRSCAVPRPAQPRLVQSHSPLTTAHAIALHVQAQCYQMLLPQLRACTSRDGPSGPHRLV